MMIIPKNSGQIPKGDPIGFRGQAFQPMVYVLNDDVLSWLSAENIRYGFFERWNYIVFHNDKDAIHFLMKWGGEVVQTETD